MTETGLQSPGERPMGRRRVLVALDVPTLVEARVVVRELVGKVGGFKVGLELITAEGGPRAVEMVKEEGGRVFFDAKFHDIPNTMANAASQVARLGVEWFTVHASAGSEALRVAAEAGKPALAIAVTVLTSLDLEAVRRLHGELPDQVVKSLASAVALAGCGGIVCSPRELAALRHYHRHLDGLLRFVAGVRPLWAMSGDQKWVETPGKAVLLGADYLVIGRPILHPPARAADSRADAAEAIVREIEEAEAEMVSGETEAG
jgi:orotidine-5'-phosphate decarboxylase